MTLLATIRDADLGYDYPFPETPDTRIAVRAFLSDDTGRIAVLWSTVKCVHKLPGGGVDDGESLEQALVRELLEETGCVISHVAYLGYVEEWRGKGGFKQTSHLYTAKVTGPKGMPSFTSEEIENGFALTWLTPQEMRARLAQESTVLKTYSGRFQNARESKLLTFLP